MEIFLSPPVVFVIALLCAMAVSEFFAGWAPKGTESAGKELPYACGEDVPAEKVLPDYQRFFPFAIFFTLLHVAGLMLATWGLNSTAGGFELVLAYVGSVAVILAVLFLG